MHAGDVGAQQRLPGGAPAGRPARRAAPRPGRGAPCASSCTTAPASVGPFSSSTTTTSSGACGEERLDAGADVLGPALDEQRRRCTAGRRARRCGPAGRRRRAARRTAAAAVSDWPSGPSRTTQPASASSSRSRSLSAKSLAARAAARCSARADDVGGRTGGRGGGQGHALTLAAPINGGCCGAGRLRAPCAARARRVGGGRGAGPGGRGLAASILRHVRDIISVVDADGIVRYVNDATTRTLGVEPESARGQASIRTGCTRTTRPSHWSGAPSCWARRAAPRRRCCACATARASGATSRRRASTCVDDPEVRGLLYVSRDVEDRRAPRWRWSTRSARSGSSPTWACARCARRTWTRWCARASSASRR